MTDRNLLRGLFVLAVSLAFGLQALRYPLGELTQAGPGLFPLAVSSVVFVIGVAMLILARFSVRHAVEFKVTNIALILASLVGFALISTYLNMTIGIAFMVLCASFAVRPYSILRNVKIAAVLIAVAFVFKYLLGLNLPLS